MPVTKFLIVDGKQFIRRSSDGTFIFKDVPEDAERFNDWDTASTAIALRNRLTGSSKQFEIRAYVQGCSCQLCVPYQVETLFNPFADAEARFKVIEQKIDALKGIENLYKRAELALEALELALGPKPRAVFTVTGGPEFTDPLFRDVLERALDPKVGFLAVPRAQLPRTFVKTSGTLGIKARGEDRIEGHLRTCAMVTCSLHNSLVSLKLTKTRRCNVCPCTCGGPA